MLVIESAGGHIVVPRRYLTAEGQVLESAPYAERVITPPDELVTHDEEGEFEVRVKARGRVARYLYRHHPLDVVGWDGHLWPFAFNIEDFEPITGRVHQPPLVHQTFEGPGFVVCSFVPRLFDYHPLSIPAPYNHSNVDSDEVIYYVAGNFMSRKGIEPGAVTVHPNGIPHGPHPGTYAGSIGKERTDELAVMVDTFRPLQMTEHACLTEDAAYPYSWLPDAASAPRRETMRCVMWNKDVATFKTRIDRALMLHPVVVDNAYTRWFATGELSLEQLRDFTVQFSVFSNQFLLAALNRVITADALHAARESKEILMNEPGRHLQRRRQSQRRLRAVERHGPRRRPSAGVYRRHRRRRAIPVRGGPF